MITSTSQQYFGYTTFAHAQGCRNAPLWEVTFHNEYDFDGGLRRVTYRLLCRSCGVVRLERFAAPSESFQTTTTQQIGYGAPAVTAAGLWLHPGKRRFYDDPEPELYLVTRSKQPPAEESDVLGAIAWDRGPRGGNTWHGYVGYNPTSEQSPTLKTRRAAAVWLAGKLADTDAPGRFWAAEGGPAQAYHLTDEDAGNATSGSEGNDG